MFLNLLLLDRWLRLLFPDRFLLLYLWLWFLIVWFLLLHDRLLFLLSRRLLILLFRFFLLLLLLLDNWLWSGSGIELLGLRSGDGLDGGTRSRSTVSGRLSQETVRRRAIRSIGSHAAHQSRSHHPQIRLLVRYATPLQPVLRFDLRNHFR